MGDTYYNDPGEVGGSAGDGVGGGGGVGMGVAKNKSIFGDVCGWVE